MLWAVMNWSMFVRLKAKSGLLARKETRCSFVAAKDESVALARPPAKAVVGYLLLKRPVRVFAKRVIRSCGVSPGSAVGMLAASGSTAVMRATQSLSSSRARFWTLASVPCDIRLSVSLTSGRLPVSSSPRLSVVSRVVRSAAGRAVFARRVFHVGPSWPLLAEYAPVNAVCTAWLTLPAASRSFSDVLPRIYGAPLTFCVRRASRSASSEACTALYEAGRTFELVASVSTRFSESCEWASTPLSTCPVNVPSIPASGRLASAAPSEAGAPS